MYTLNAKNIKWIQTAAITIFLLLINALAYAQLPTNVPSPEAEPVDFFGSWGNVILYIILPAFIIVMYLIWRFRSKKTNRRGK